MRTTEAQVTRRECDAMRLLKRDGWNIKVLRTVFQVGDVRTVKYHVYGKCKHENRIEVVDDGRNNFDRHNGHGRGGNRS